MPLVESVAWLLHATVKASTWVWLWLLKERFESALAESLENHEIDGAYTEGNETECSSLPVTWTGNSIRGQSDDTGNGTEVIDSGSIQDSDSMDDEDTEVFFKSNPKNQLI